MAKSLNQQPVHRFSKALKAVNVRSDHRIGHSSVLGASGPLAGGSGPPGFPKF